MDIKKSEKLTSSPRTQIFINQEPQDEEASDCPLLSPSPPSGETPDPLETVTMFNPLEDTPLEMTPTPTLNNLNSEEGLKAFMNIVNSNNIKLTIDEPSSRDPMVESSSSEEGTSKEPVCTQLLTQLNTAYQHLAPDAQAIFYNQDNGGKPPLVGIQLVVPKPPKDYSFTRWNWPKIRQGCFWLMVCILTLTTALAVRGIATLPTRCDPPTNWWQGKVFYEIFPASFQESTKRGDGIGDLQGILMRINYLKNLGIETVRLNSILASAHYPEQYTNINTLTRMDENLGTIEDFDLLVDTMHKNNMTLILDIPSHPMIEDFKTGLKRKKMQLFVDTLNDNEKRVKREKIIDSTSEKNQEFITSLFNENEPRSEKFKSSNLVDSSRVDNEVTSALKYWSRKKVDGFYLKGLEDHIEDSDFVNYLQEWRDSVKYPKILMCNWKAYQLASDLVRSTILNTIDLLDVPIKLSNGTQEIKRQIEEVTKSELFNSPEEKRPWIHWSIGSVETSRVSSSLPVRNSTTAAMILEMMLPGTVNIFYGDEIGMTDCECEDHRDLLHLHNLAPMAWENVKDTNEMFSSDGVIPWLPNSVQPISTNMADAIINMIKLRKVTAPIFVDTGTKHNRMSVNCDVRYIHNQLIVIERWYPRQNTYVLVANFGNSTLTKDLSSLYYEGDIVVGPSNKINQSVYFKELIIFPGEAFVIKLKK